MTPLPTPKALDQFYLEARSKILDLAGMLDRVDRGNETSVAGTDPRLLRLRQGIQLLLGSSPDRAEKVQQLFSLEYDPNWKRPEPRF